MIKLFVLLGGNLGDKPKLFSETRDRLNQIVGTITRESSIYETEPWGFESENNFWNQVLEISTSLGAEEVLQKTQAIELESGRIRKSGKYESRCMDIDLLFYGDQIISLENLIIPHPRIQERKFVLIPLVEIASNLKHPVIMKSIGQLLNECSDALKVNKIIPGSSL